MLATQHPVHPKRSARFVAIVALVILSMLPIQAGLPGIHPLAESGAASQDARSIGPPLAFEANVGQAGLDVRFMAHTHEGGSLLFGSSEVVLEPAPARASADNPTNSSLRLQFIGANQRGTVQAGDPL